MKANIQESNNKRPYTPSTNVPTVRAIKYSNMFTESKLKFYLNNCIKIVVVESGCCYSFVWCCYSVCVCVYVCIYMYVRTYVCIYVCMYVFMYIPAYVRT